MADDKRKRQKTDHVDHTRRLEGERYAEAEEKREFNHRGERKPSDEDEFVTDAELEVRETDRPSRDDEG